MTRFSIFSATVVLALSLVAPSAGQDTPFEPGRNNDPETCKELWQGIGLPEYARDDDDERVTVCHTRYVLSHNSATKTPDWVLEHLTPKQLGKQKRPKQSFRADPDLPKDGRAVDDDYRGSKFDRGHQAPSADFSKSSELMAESFFLSNIVPQVGKGFNQSIWKQLEDLTRDLVTDSGRPELYIITGPVYRSDDGRAIIITANANACRKRIVIEMPKRELICGKDTKCKEGVAVPAALFKVIYDPGLRRANAFIMPNINHNESPEFEKNPLEYLKKFQTSVQVVEQHTGLEFFRGLPARTRRPILTQCTTMMLH